MNLSSIVQKGKSAFLWILHLSLLKKLVILAVIALLIWFVGKPLLFDKKGTEISYQTSEAEKGTLITSITASGTISSAGSASITSSATGIVKEVYVQDGQRVNEGDPIALVTLDQDSQQQQLQAYASYLSAQNSLNSANAKMNSLQATLFKTNQEFVNGAGTSDPDTDDPNYIIQRDTWLQAEADYTNQATVIAQAEATLQSAWLSYSQLSPTITAPISGVVSNLSLTEGLSIEANTNSSDDSSSNNTNASQTFGTVTLSDAKPQATVNVSEIDIVNVKIGQKATLTLDAFPDKTFTGKVAAVNTTGTSSSGVTTYPVTIAFDTAVETMYPNMAVNATIITSVTADVLLVPSGAVQTTDGISTVRLMKNGQETSVQVEIGSSSDTQTEILSGLSEGDTVITGQLGGFSAGATSSQTASPFGSSGFGGGRSGGSAGGVFMMR